MSRLTTNSNEHLLPLSRRLSARAARRRDERIWRRSLNAPLRARMREHDRNVASTWFGYVWARAFGRRKKSKPVEAPA